MEGHLLAAFAFGRTMSLIHLICINLILVIPCNCNQYDPHVYPESGPFFEGWYARMTDLENQRSFGVLFGEVLPGSESRRNSTPTTYIGLIRSNGNRPMVAAEAFPNPNEIKVTVRKGKHGSAHWLNLK